MRQHLLTWYGITNLRAAIGFEEHGGPISEAVLATQVDGRPGSAETVADQMASVLARGRGKRGLPEHQVYIARWKGQWLSPTAPS